MHASPHTHIISAYDKLQLAAALLQQQHVEPSRDAALARIGPHTLCGDTYRPRGSLGMREGPLGREIIVMAGHHAQESLVCSRYCSDLQSLFIPKIVRNNQYCTLC